MPPQLDTTAAIMIEDNNNNADPQQTGATTTAVAEVHNSLWLPSSVAYPHHPMLNSSSSNNNNTNIGKETQAATNEENDDSVEMYSNVLKKLMQCADELEKKCAQQTAAGNADPCHSSSLLRLNDACLFSIQLRMPHLLNQAKVLIETLENEKSIYYHHQVETAMFIQKLRSRFALTRSAQCLDTIETCMTCDEAHQLNQALETILKNNPPHHDPTLSFRVSHWIAPSLAFDLPVGDTAIQTISATSNKKALPVEVEVEPVVTFHANDLLNSGAAATTQLRYCKVEIESCKHTPRECSEGAGIVGLAIVRVRVSPLQEATKSAMVWRNHDQEGEKLIIKAARAIQRNAFPPKPRANVDLFTHDVYGDSGSSVTLVVKTCTTECGSPPSIHVELLVGTSSK